MKNKFYILIFICLLPSLAFSQTVLDRFVLSPTGGFAQGSTFSISFTTGQPAVSTLVASGFILTQGFEQPNFVQLAPIEVQSNIVNSSCYGSSDGMVSFTSISGCIEPYSITWSNGDTGLVASGLDAGLYTAYITGGNGCIDSIEYEISIINTVPCDLEIYNAITPNGDGYNEHFHISNIELYTYSRVTIFNRLGTKIWEAEYYNNDDIAWKGTKMNGEPTLDGTYFYVIELPNKVIYEGFIEVTR